MEGKDKNLDTIQDCVHHIKKLELGLNERLEYIENKLQAKISKTRRDLEDIEEFYC